MGRRGRKWQPDVESRYWQLLLTGIGTVEACRLVGITRKTGYRWRAEYGGVPPTSLAEAARSNRYLSLLERQRIATLRGQGLGVREIARRLDRSASTVSRELRRNLRPHDKNRYDADLAHARARHRARRVQRGRLVDDVGLRRWSRTSSSRTGARSRSPSICAAPTRTVRRGTSATRRSTRRSTTAGRAA